MHAIGISRTAHDYRINSFVSSITFRRLYRFGRRIYRQWQQESLFPSPTRPFLPLACSYTWVFCVYQNSYAQFGGFEDSSITFSLHRTKPYIHTYQFRVKCAHILEPRAKWLNENFISNFIHVSVRSSRFCLFLVALHVLWWRRHCVSTQHLFSSNYPIYAFSRSSLLFSTTTIRFLLLFWFWP